MGRASSRAFEDVIKGRRIPVAACAIVPELPGDVAFEDFRKSIEGCNFASFSCEAQKTFTL